MESMNIGAEHAAQVDARAVGSWDVERTVDLCGRLSELAVTETLIPTASAKRP
ncbi:MAG: hypothetical protein JWM91_2585 [Rhodospirillales bacterium]|nr:hypothetical protein [Rhodospirillales bacterium]